MSGQTEATRQGDFVMPPMVDSSGNPAAATVATSSTVVAVDLASIPGVPGTADPAVKAADPNPLGHYITVAAMGADAYVIFGPTFASVTGANAPLASTTSAVSGVTGAVTQTKQTCYPIPAGTAKDFKLPLGNEGTASGTKGQASPARFMAIVTKGAATGFATIYQSSP